MPDRVATITCEPSSHATYGVPSDVAAIERPTGLVTAVTFSGSDPNVAPADADEYSSSSWMVNATSSLPFGSIVEATRSSVVSFSGFVTSSVAITLPWFQIPSCGRDAVMTAGMSGRLRDRAGATCPFGSF